MDKEEFDDLCKGIAEEGYTIIGIKIFDDDTFFYLKKDD